MCTRNILSAVAYRNHDVLRKKRIMSKILPKLNHFTKKRDLGLNISLTLLF